jgi:hypothetical protein
VASSFYDNPAGRLHALLIQIEKQDPNASILSAWSKVLGVAKQDVVLHIGEVADLVRQIQEAVNEIGEDFLTAPVARYRADWAKPIFAPEHPFNAALQKVRPGGGSLESLHSVAAHLHTLAPEGKVPDADERDDLQEKVRDLVDAIREADDLPDDVKHAVVERLLDVDRAITHIKVGGPEAVSRALEAVMGTMARTAANPMTARSASIQKLWATLAVIWVSFNAGPKIQDSIEAWSTIVHETTSGQIEHADDGKSKPSDEHARPDKPKTGD